MAFTRQHRQIMKMDVEIFELERLYYRELGLEAEQSKKNLLMSKGIKNKLEKLKAKRKLLVQMTHFQIARKTSFLMELTERKNDVLYAEKEVQEITQEIAATLNQIRVNQSVGLDVSEDVSARLRYLIKDLPRAKDLVEKKQKLVDNWFINGEPEAARRAKSLSDDEVKEAQIAAGLLYIEQLDFDKKQKQIQEAAVKSPETVVNLDIFTRAEELKREEESEFDISRDELKELEKMHTTHYQPPIID